MKIRHYFQVAALVALVASCSSKDANESVGPMVHDSTSRTYYVRGFVRGENLEEKTVTIEHEDIPGFMPSMTMPFSLKDRREFEQVAVGDAVQFKLTLTDTDSWIGSVKKIDPGTVHLPKADASKAASDPAERLREGDVLPAFKLVDQGGRTLTPATLAGKSVVLTFIFTRCPLPNFCPLMSKHFSQLQKEIKSDSTLKGRVQLLSISFDPEHDTPGILAQYGRALTHDLDSWRFATGTPKEINQLTSEFSVYIKAEGGTISHGLCTALISPEGRIERIWRGNGWEDTEVLEALHNNLANR